MYDDTNSRLVSVGHRRLLLHEDGRNSPRSTPLTAVQRQAMPDPGSTKKDLQKVSFQAQTRREDLYLACVTTAFLLTRTAHRGIP